MLSFARYNIEALESIYSEQVLLALYERGRMFKGELYTVLSANNKSVAQRLVVLKDLGLIKETVETAKPYRIYVELSETGRRIAEHLHAIEMELRSL